MPYQRPTLTQLRQQALSDIQAGIQQFGVDSLLSVAVLRVMAWVQAGMAHMHYGYLDYIYQQSEPFTATDEALDGWAGLKGVVREDATLASGTFASSGGVPGTPLPSGTSISRQDAFSYVTTVIGTVDGNGNLSVPIIANAAGSVGNSAAGTLLTIGSPVAGINSSGSASGPLTGGTDQETDASFRTRMQQAYSAPAQGGDQGDYVTWALDVPGVSRAWCVPNGGGPGTVFVYTMFDEAESAYAGFPQGANGVSSQETRDVAATGDQLAVANGIAPAQPVTALVYSLAPLQYPIAFTVIGLASTTSAIQQGVTAAIADMLLRLGTATGGSIFPSDTDAAIQSVPGVPQFTLAAPTTVVTTPSGSLPVLGPVTFE